MEQGIIFPPGGQVFNRSSPIANPIDGQVSFSADLVSGRPTRPPRFVFLADEKSRNRKLRKNCGARPSWPPKSGRNARAPGLFHNLSEVRRRKKKTTACFFVLPAPDSVNLCGPTHRVQGYSTLARAVFSGAGTGGGSGLTGTGSAAGLGDGTPSAGISLTAGVGETQLPRRL